MTEQARPRATASDTATPKSAEDESGGPTYKEQNMPPCADCTDESRCDRFGVCQSYKFPLPGAYEARVKELAPELGMPLAMSRADMESGPLTDIHGYIASERATQCNCCTNPLQCDQSCRQDQRVREIVRRTVLRMPKTQLTTTIRQAELEKFAGLVIEEAGAYGVTAAPAPDRNAIIKALLTAQQSHCLTAAEIVDVVLIAAGLDLPDGAQR